MATRLSGEKDEALAAIAKNLSSRAAEVLGANAVDVKLAEAAGLSPALVDRLTLDSKRLSQIASSVLDIIALPDPVGRLLSGTTHENGMKIEKITVPLGVIGMIFEARPNVACDAAALSIKSGNAVILRGGKEALNSNKAIVNIIRDSLTQVGLPADCVQLLCDTSHETAVEMMRLSQYIDVLIPRGGARLIRTVVENSTVPVIETGTGNCHIYVDEFADIKKAVDIVYNAKCSRPSVCNACESLLIHEKMAYILPKIKAALDIRRVEIFGCEKTRELLDCSPATQEDFATEYLDFKLSCKIVSSLDEALEHISRFGTHHSEAIVTENYSNAEKFVNSVDAAAVYVNASTRFTDGGVFGFGAEIGISTQKLHARGPVGLPELVSYKYVIRGDGQIR